MGANLNKENRLFFNHSFDKKRLKALISWVFKQSGEAKALKVVDLLKETGFKYATNAGISIGLHDLTTPIQKSWLVSESQLAMNTTERDFIGARITATERSQRIIDTWHRASESLSKQVVDYFGIYDRFNPVYIMALSGARGNFSQVRQLIGMRGLMADQQGKIVNFPIRSNLREGLTLTEYFISCSGARKGLVDTALRTADTGYLTRRLVDVSHHVVVKRIRCNTTRGIAFKSLQSYNKVLLALRERLVGRVLAEDVFLTNRDVVLDESCRDPFYFFERVCHTGKAELRKGTATFCKQKGKSLFQPALQRSFLKDSEEKHSTNLLFAKNYKGGGDAGQNQMPEPQKNIVKRDQEISLKLALKIVKARDKVYLRSPLTCGFTDSVCQLCYGWSISQGSLVSLGDAVGVIAAQSIGEPGTQLTMRTFHTGGVFSGDLLQEIRSPHAGTIEFSKAFQGLLIRTAHGRIAFLSKTEGSLLLRKSHSKQSVSKEETKGVKSIPVPAFTMLFVRQGEKVEQNQLLAEFSIRTKEGNQPIKTQQIIFAELSGRVVEDSSGKLYTKSIKESALLLNPLENQQPNNVTSFCKESQESVNKADQRKQSGTSFACKNFARYGRTSLDSFSYKREEFSKYLAAIRHFSKVYKGLCNASRAEPRLGYKIYTPSCNPAHTKLATVQNLPPSCASVRMLYSARIRRVEKAPSTFKRFCRRFRECVALADARVGQGLPLTKHVLANPRPFHTSRAHVQAKQSRTSFLALCTKQSIASLYLSACAQRIAFFCKNKTCTARACRAGTALYVPGSAFAKQVRSRFGCTSSSNLHAQALSVCTKLGSVCFANRVREKRETRVGQLEQNPYTPCWGRPVSFWQNQLLTCGPSTKTVQNNFDTGLTSFSSTLKLPVSIQQVKKKVCFAPRSRSTTEILFSQKSEDLEGDAFKYIEPVQSGRLGYLKILSTRIGAKLDYVSPIKSLDAVLNEKKRHTHMGFLFFKDQQQISSFGYFRGSSRSSSRDRKRVLRNKKGFSERRSSSSFTVRPGQIWPQQELGHPMLHSNQTTSESKENAFKKKESPSIFYSNLTNRYLHPESISESRFPLQTIAEYGDVVEEGYSYNM